MAKGTVVQKIIDRNYVSGDKCIGRPVAIRINQTLTQDATGTMAYLELEAMQIPAVKTELSVSYVDHNMMQNGPENRNDHVYLQSVANAKGVRFSPPGNGICHQVHLERFGVPGKTLIGSDSHTPTGGGIGMLAIGAGGLDVALAMAGKPFRIPYPKVIGVKLTNKLGPWCAAKDVILHLLSILTTKGNVGSIVEYFGPGVASLTVPQRATITNMGAELGVTTSVFPSDESTRKFLKAQQREADYVPLAADADAEYDQVIEIDLAKVVPLAACPSSPDNIKPIEALAGTKVGQVIIGSCTNSSYRDLAMVAMTLKGRKVNPNLTLAIAPGSRQVLEMLSRNGMLADIIGAGGVGLTNVSTPLAWLGIIAYSLQLYFDFAGYSEMSNGLAALLGFDCPANFNLPYISGSITEFWRRWHITLSGWFRDYIYIPLGGNRKGQARQLLNMFLVWAATGIWHGASWNFIAWGLYYFVLLTIEKTFLLKYLKKGKVWPHIYTLFFVVLGWGIFTANQPGAPLGLLLQKLFVPHGGISHVNYLRNYGVLLVLGCVCSSALPHWLWEKISKNTVAKLLVFALLTALCVCYVVAATNATALYANF